MTGRRARIAGVVGLLLLASAAVAIPQVRLRDPAARARHRWWVTVLGEGGVADAVPLFGDALRQPLDPRRVRDPRSDPTGRILGQVPDARFERPVFFATRGGAILTDRGPLLPPPGAVPRWNGHESPPTVPPDPWGNAWVLVVDSVVLDGRRHRAGRPLGVVSAGPDGRFELGPGDDLVVPLDYHSVPMHHRDGVTRPIGVPWDTEPAWAIAAALLGGLWAPWVGWRAPRRASLAGEAGLTALVALAIEELAPERLLPTPRGLLLVSARAAIACALSGAIRGAVFWRRRRPPAGGTAA